MRRGCVEFDNRVTARHISRSYSPSGSTRRHGVERGTEIALEADGVDRGYLCSTARADAPTAGTLELAGTCVGIAVVQAALDVAL